MQKISRFSIFGLLALFLAGCSGLANEPVIIRTQAVSTVTPTPPPDRGIPPEPVSLIRGSVIYDGAQGCQNCHGTSGKGDGATASSLTCRVPDLTNPNTARGDALTKWFAITSFGNGQTQGCLMPPWNKRLTEQQRWDVTAFMYSIHYTPAQLVAGKTIYTENCASCHGDKGLGDGPKAKDSARPVTNLADSQYMITHSDQSIFTAVTNGVGAIMPAFPQLTEEQRWSVVAYARSLSWLDVQSPNAVNKVTYTDDKHVIRLQQMEIRLDFGGNVLNIQQGFSFVNTDTLRTFQTRTGGSLEIPLPAGATQIFLDAQMRSNFSIREGSNPAILGLNGLAPGATQLLLVEYSLPFSIPFQFTQVAAYDIGQASVLIPESANVGIVERNFSLSQIIPDQTPDGRSANYRQYVPSGNVLAGLPFQFMLDQQSKLNAQENAERRNTLAAVLILSIAAFAVVVIGVWRIGKEAG